MKEITKALICLFLAVTAIQCTGQQMMRTLGDAKKLKTNENIFVGKPLKNLLQEIKPQIKMVTANPSTSNRVRLGYFIFRFVDPNDYNSKRSEGKFPLQITVFVKESFKWNFKNKDEKNEFLWSKEDMKKYGNLTIVGIRIFGNTIVKDSLSAEH